MINDLKSFQNVSCSPSDRRLPLCARVISEITSISAVAVGTRGDDGGRGCLNMQGRATASGPSCRGAGVLVSLL